MNRIIERIREAKHYRKFRDAPRGLANLDAVVASTSPKRSIDLKRADYAFDAVFALYGNPSGGSDGSDSSEASIDGYTGLFIAAGRLNEPGVYEGSQRQGIVNRLSEHLRNHNITEKRLIQIDGEDTIDKVRELGNIPEIKDGKVEYLGIASYPLHIARFNLGLLQAQREGYISGRVQIVGIETPYDALFFETNPFRVGDWVTGAVGLVKDARRLNKYGFQGSLPGQNSKFHSTIKTWNSEDRGKTR